MNNQIEAVSVAPGSLQRLRTAFSLRRSFHDLFVRPADQVAFFDGIRGFFLPFILVAHALMIYCIAHPDFEPYQVIEDRRVGWLAHADHCVDIFFALSGFLISLILFRQLDKRGRIDIGQFYLRRYLRLTPVYLVAIGIYWLARGPNWQNLWANALYVNNFLPRDEQAMHWTWSLAIEEQFYLIYPLALGYVITRSRRALGWLWISFFLSFVIRFLIVVTDEQILNMPASQQFSDQAYIAHVFSALYDNFYSRYGGIVIGCIAAYYFHYQQARTKAFFASNAGQCVGVLGWVLIVAMFAFPIFERQYDDALELQVIYKVVNHNLASTAFTMVLLASLPAKNLFSRVSNAIFGSRFWYPLGQLTYSMYIFHLMVIGVVAPTFANIAVKQPEVLSGSMLEVGLIVAGVSYVITLVVSIFFYVLVERPFMNVRS